MATTVAQLVAKLSADTSNFDRKMSASDRAFQKVGKSIHRSAMFIGAGILAGLGITAKIGWDEFAQGQKVVAQTNAVLESTGGVANVTAKHVQDLSNSLMRLSGVDDEAIAGGENLLLTFRGIRNEVGKGNDIFDQATKATLDLSVAMGKDMNTSAILVGKALQDPIRGMTALRRVGVQLTLGQEALIKKMVASGNTMGAQKVILRELNKEFGGSAKAAGETLPGQLGVLRERFSDFAGELVAGAIPRLLALIGLFERHTTLVKIGGIALGTLTVGILAASVALKTYSLAQGIALLFTNATNAALIAQRVLIAVSLVGALILLATILIMAYKRSETFRNVVNAAFHSVQAVVGAVVAFIRQHWMLLLAVLGGPIGVVAGQIIKHWQAIRNVGVAAFQAIVGPIITVVSWINALIGAISRIHWPSKPSWLGHGLLTGQHGGIVPGAIGAPRLILAHGGETVLPTHLPGASKARGMMGSGATTVYNFNGAILDGQKLLAYIREQESRYRRQHGRPAFGT